MVISSPSCARRLATSCGLAIKPAQTRFRAQLGQPERLLGHVAVHAGFAQSLLVRTGQNRHANKQQRPAARPRPRPRSCAGRRSRCSVSMATPSAPAAATAFATVFGMSCSLRSRKIFAPNERHRAHDLRPGRGVEFEPDLEGGDFGRERAHAIQGRVRVRKIERDDEAIAGVFGGVCRIHFVMVPCNSMQLRAPAKINLSFRILGRRADGFHEIETVMAPISLYDEITLTRNRRTTKGSASPATIRRLPSGDDNLAVRAARIFFRETTLRAGVAIALRKSIPHGAGLAGGSSDAASVLLGLESDVRRQAHGCGNWRRWRLRSDRTCHFSSHESAAVCRGRGELVSPIELPRPLPLCSCSSRAFGVPTPWAYGRWKDAKELPGVSYAPQEFAGHTFRNDLERPVFEKYLFLARAQDVAAPRNRKSARRSCPARARRSSPSCAMGRAPRISPSARRPNSIRETVDALPDVYPTAGTAGPFQLRRNALRSRLPACDRASAMQAIRRPFCAGSRGRIRDSISR